MPRITSVGHIFLKGHILKIMEKEFEVRRTGLRSRIYESSVNRACVVALLDYIWDVL
jgi:hypothetical protein